MSARTIPVATANRGRLGWAQRLKRVFAIDIEKCDKCGGKLYAARMKVIACIEDRDAAPPAVIDKILKHLGLDESSTARNRSPPNQTGEDMFALS